MNNQKLLQFQASAGSYFVLCILSVIMAYIPFFGWAFLLNYSSGWLADNLLVNGKKVTYKASYGESFKFIFGRSLLVIVTFGIYAFWFMPQAYRYVADHMAYLDEVTDSPVAAAVDVVAAFNPAPAPVTPEVPVDPTRPQPPTTLIGG